VGKNISFPNAAMKLLLLEEIENDPQNSNLSARCNEKDRVNS